MGETGAYGYYGKAPCRGDFLRCGLSPGLVSAWDAAMQALGVAQVTLASILARQTA